MIQGGEILIILLVILVVFGPARLPDMAQRLGRWTAELRRAAREMSRGLEAEVSELKQTGAELRAPLEELGRPLEEIREEIGRLGVTRYEWSGPKPVSGPTPEEAMADLERIERAAEEEE